MLFPHLFLHLPLCCWRCAMYDDTPLEVEELIDHCRALIYAIVTIERADAKEVLSLILWQQIDALRSTYLRDSEEPLEVVYAL
ncbi:hypothetical protein A6J63_012005 [Yersinia enterocolitica]|nr:hypothetical protein A6J63_012005 [Yersinia enterocolitica]